MATAVLNEVPGNLSNTTAMINALGGELPDNNDNNNNNNNNNIASSEEEEHQQPDLAWRRDPEESYSDWTVRVIRKKEEGDKADSTTAISAVSTAVTTSPTTEDDNHRCCVVGTNNCSTSHPRHHDYHVHRVYLASGPRKSEYFKTLFSTQAATMEQEHRMTELTLSETAYEAFDSFLDFVYGGEDALTMTTDSVVAIHYLADYLQVSPLLKITASFIRQDLKGSNVHIYCREALLYSVDWVVEHCIQEAAFSPQDLLTWPSTTGGEVEPALTLTTSLSSMSSSFSPTSSEVAAVDRAVQQVMAMLPLVKQVQLLQLALSKSLDELRRFKRVPSRWKENIKDVRATHLPTLVKETMHYPLQGSGLEFPGRVCPLFYFDQPQSDAHQQDQQHREDSPFADRNNRLQMLQHSSSPFDNLGFGDDVLMRVQELYHAEVDSFGAPIFQHNNNNNMG
ncbi:BTB/POZ domain containing protein [Nitzschia inconspicua]|uniref:BTB/POZ domain containing protein n=1 Tax=Nitzschia inconspicua TaxID=303405 RepID=A0A9K3KSH7_9STRA|nr:BTB/POZ domain containing protein [Nitzschia inconspicua]